MIHLKPFKAVRPTRDKAYLLATRSYVEYNNEELEEKLRNNPFSFFHVIAPDKEHDMKGKDKFKMVRQKFEEFNKQRFFIEEKEPVYYIYQQQTPTHVFTGIIGAVSTEDYNDGKIKKHEHTITHRENLFAEYLVETGFNAEPVLLMHKPLHTLADVKHKYMEMRAEYEFTSTDRILHLLWPVSDKDDVELISKAFESVDELYIADGHHRCASSSHVAKMMEDNPLSKDFMAFLIPETNIKISEFNRLIKTLNSHTKKEFLDLLEEDFVLNYIPKDYYRPKAHQEMGLYIDGDWYSLYPKPGSFNPEDPVDCLDCKIVSQNILDKILHIRDERQDPNVEFSPGADGITKLMNKVNSGKFAMALTFYPVSIDQLKNVADAEMYMPPKSTYIQPKLRSGLTIYTFK